MGLKIRKTMKWTAQLSLDAPFFSVNKIYSHAEVDEEVEEGLVEIEHPEEEEQIMLTWDDCGYSVTPKPLADIAARAKEGSSEDKAILDYYRQ